MIPTSLIFSYRLCVLDLPGWHLGDVNVPNRQIWMDNNREVKELEDTGLDRMRAAMDFVQQLPATPSMPSRLQAESTMQQLQSLSINQASVLR